MKLVTKLLLGVVLILSLLVLGGRWYFFSKLPTVDGSIRVDNVTRPVSVIRDEWGVPHIEAESAEDAYFALGFTIAQDRLFQMDLQRRAAKGELSELFGENLIDIDKMFRTLMIKHRSEEYLLNEKTINPDALAFLDSFIDGINYYIFSESTPIEYTFLNAKPQVFSRLDSIASMGFVAFTFADAVKRDALYSQFKAALPRQDLNILFPTYSDANQSTIMEPDGLTSEENRVDNRSKNIESNFMSTSNIDTFNHVFNYLHDQSQLFVPSFIGSNSWVLAPSRSSTGSALLANDPHVGISNPGVWYEVHIKYPEYENYGYHLPLMPFPMLGHNETKAWALTMFENDDMDLYAETLHPQDPQRVQYKGEWVPVRTIKETILVKGESPETLEIRVTPHGPIISDFIDGYSGKPVAIHWAYLNVENPILDVVYGMGKANNMTEFRSSISKLAAPGLSISYIDHQGNIAWWAAGRLPIRPENVSGKEIHEGGSGKEDWLGYLPFSKNPHQVNPSSGVIITANNLPTHNEIKPIGVLSGYFRPDDRAARIHHLMGQKQEWSLEELKSIQTDVHLAKGLLIARKFVELIERQNHKLSTTEANALSQLNSWDGETSLDSVGTTVFEFTLYHFINELLIERVGEEGVKQYLNLFDYWSFLKLFSGELQNELPVGNTSMFSRNLDDVALIAFQAAVEEMVVRLGGSEADWQWANVHTIEFSHPLGKVPPLDLIFNIGPFASVGEFPAVNKLRSKIGEHDYKVISLPSTRRLISINSHETSWSILPTGNSGNKVSPFYDNQTEMYLNNQYRKIIYTESEIKESQKHKLMILPSSTM